MRPLVGLGMLGVSAVMIYGGITGRLGPMLAALFVPSQLQPVSSSEPGFWDQLLGIGDAPFLPQLPGGIPNPLNLIP
jgi:hypothetical protein